MSKQIKSFYLVSVLVPMSFRRRRGILIPSDLAINRVATTGVFGGLEWTEVGICRLSDFDLSASFGESDVVIVVVVVELSITSLDLSFPSILMTLWWNKSINSFLSFMSLTTIKAVVSSLLDILANDKFNVTSISFNWLSDSDLETFVSWIVSKESSSYLFRIITHGIKNIICTWIGQRWSPGTRTYSLV